MTYLHDTQATQRSADQELVDRKVQEVHEAQEEMRAELDELRGELSRVEIGEREDVTPSNRARVAGAKSAAAVERRLQAARELVASLKNRLAQAEDELAEKDAAIDEQKVQTELLENRLSKANSEIAEYASSTERSMTRGRGRSSPLPRHGGDTLSYVPSGSVYACYQVGESQPFKVLDAGVGSAAAASTCVSSTARKCHVTDPTTGRIKPNCYHSNSGPKY